MDDFEDHISSKIVSPNAQMIRKRRVSQPALTSALNECQHYFSSDKKIRISPRISNSPKSVFEMNRISRSTSQTALNRNGIETRLELYSSATKRSTDSEDASIRKKPRLSQPTQILTLDESEPEPHEPSEPTEISLDVDLVSNRIKFNYYNKPYNLRFFATKNFFLLYNFKGSYGSGFSGNESSHQNSASILPSSISSIQIGKKCMRLY